MKNSILSSVFILVLLSCGKKTESVKPTVGQITESVYASGNIKADEQYSVYPSVTGIIRYVGVEPGDSVHVGDTLFIVDNVSSRLNSESALTTLELTQENAQKGSDKLQEMELAVNQAYEKYLLDSTLFVRQKNLWNQAIGSKMEFEQRELNFKNSRSLYESARARFGQVKTQLQSELRKASISYKLASKNENDFVLKSDLTGRVFDVLKDKNDMVTQQSALAVIGKSNAFIIELQVDEYDIGKILRGQRVIITMDSHQDELFEAIVDRINPIMNEKTRTFTVEAKFLNAPGNLYPNLTVEANIILRIKENALTIPRKFLEDSKYVYLEKEERREVKIGLSDYQKVEITEGLDSAVLIYLPTAK